MILFPSFHCTVAHLFHIDNRTLLSPVARYIALVSGLDIGGQTENSLELQLLVDLLTGQLGDVGQQEQCARIVRVIVAGNSLSQDTQDKDQITKVEPLSTYI